MLINCPAHTTEVIACKAGGADGHRKYTAVNNLLIQQSPGLPAAEPGSKAWLSLPITESHIEAGVDLKLLQQILQE